MADPIYLEVRCVDAANSNFPVDNVSLADSFGGRKTIGGGPYRFLVSAAMEGTLEIRKAGLHDWNFKVRVTEAKGELHFKFHENGLSPPAMAAVNAVAAVAATGKNKEYMCTFTLGTCKEVVLVSGVDYHGGGTNIAYATTHMHEIWNAKSIDAQTLVTVFDFATGMRERWVKGIGAEKLSKQKFTSGWCLLSADLQGTVAPVLVHGGGNPGADSISITHVYRHMEETGRHRPRSVTEFSIFSHSWVGGPIMFNTGERAPYKYGGALEEERDPLDHDARYWKDFNPTNMPDLVDFMNAFSATCFIKIWGCLAVTVYRGMVNKIRKAPNDVAALGVAKDDRTDWETTPPTVYADNRPGIIDYLNKVARVQNYMHTLAQITGRPVWGGAPGTGALLLSNGTWNWMYMPEYQLEYKGGKRVNKGPYYKNELNYMKSTLGFTFSADWYMEYT